MPTQLVRRMCVVCKVLTNPGLLVKVMGKAVIKHIHTVTSQVLTNLHTHIHICTFAKPQSTHGVLSALLTRAGMMGFMHAFRVGYLHTAEPSVVQPYPLLEG